MTTSSTAHCPARPARAFRCALDLPGWSVRSVWGWDAVFECYWAELVPEAHGLPVLRVGTHHLVPTLGGLARAIGALSARPPEAVLLALWGAALDRREHGSRLNLDARTRRKEHHMGADDKASNVGEDWKGKAKEAVGSASDDRELEAEGKADQSKSDIKQAGEKVKDAFKR